jgi:uncharacterized protein with FMN-binding domain
MRRITIAVMGTVSALVALFSYHTSTSSQSSGAGIGASSDAGTPGAATSTGPSDPADPSGTSSSGTYTGDAANTRWGIVQVEITVKNGRITKSEAVQYPTGNPRDQEINSYAVPELNSEVVQNQKGSIDAVSGATVTSDGYIQSLQSAIDQANL